MALILQLPPNLEESLRTQARAEGLSLEQYVQALLEKQLAPVPREEDLTLEQFEAALDSIAMHSDKIPHLPLEALTREAIYKDHD
jgi:hypothetical protein